MEGALSLANRVLCFTRCTKIHFKLASNYFNTYKSNPAIFGKQKSKSPLLPNYCHQLQQYSFTIFKQN